MKLIEPIVDEARGVRWWQYVHQSGQHITIVESLSTPQQVYSNCYPVDGLSDPDLDKLVELMRDNPPTITRSRRPNSVPGTYQ